MVGSGVCATIFGRAGIGAAGRIDPADPRAFAGRGLMWVDQGEEATIEANVASGATSSSANSPEVSSAVRWPRPAGTPNDATGPAPCVQTPASIGSTGSSPAEAAATFASSCESISIERSAGAGAGATSRERNGCGQPKLCTLGAGLLLSAVSTAGQVGFAGRCMTQLSGSVSVRGRSGPAGTTWTTW